MAKPISVPSKRAQLHVVSSTGQFPVSRVQRASFTGDLPSTTVDELGNSSHVGDVKDVPTVTLTFSVFDVGIKAFAALTGTSATAYPAAGVDISELGEFDAIIFTRSDITSDYIKAGHLRRLQIRDFTYTYTVDGESTEDYTAIGSEKRWFSKDVVVDRFVAGTTSFTLTNTPIILKNGRKVLSVILDGVYLTEVAAAPASGEYAVAGTTLTTFDSRVTDCVVIYQADPVGSNWSDVSDTQSAVAIRGRDVHVNIAANDISRVQSINFNGTLNATEVRELGNRTILGYQKQVPEITGTITVLDTDTELMSLLQYGVVASGSEYSPGEGCVAGGVAIKIELTDPCDETVPLTVLKTVYADSISVTGDSYTMNVGDNVTVAFNFKSTTGHLVVYSGEMP